MFRDNRLYDSDKWNAFATISATTTSIDPHYPFVLDPDTKTVVAHGAIPARIGTPSLIIAEDYADKPYDTIIDELQDSDGTWVKYLFPHPESDYVESKRSWLVLHDGYIFGSGYYSTFTTIQR